MGGDRELVMFSILLAAVLIGRKQIYGTDV
ncbi:hypothetical protein [Escherichia coli]